MKEALIIFLEWMNQTTIDNPMMLETDNDDIVMMFLSENPKYVNELYEMGYKKGFEDSTSEAISEIRENYKPRDL